MKVNLMGYAAVNFEDEKSGDKIEGTSIFIVYDDLANDRLKGKCAQKKFVNANVSRTIDFDSCLKTQLCDIEYNQAGKIIGMVPFQPENVNKVPGLI